ncbi:hypothetical protein A2617_03830 [Candidatus Daviesbacteria bacterium RIFOXYD1_FULL_41_10]|uniref:tRNA dimethylallyltransferase n=2 Tax=Candidatus Daviesiibacteriota TaxID=1752718 RepID=A0A1F5MZY2_9BACT|nr:MAG: tRNA dimethylallyltransferase 1 [Candidatus Daviesbacteria bacterium GW2011_GWB1_41_5]OGE70947.1 MAG: hypothetical protein A2617_03830 [Candidatus Daviesbacteria bacterium RIFOXYD1_FULL_41_10]
MKKVLAILGPTATGKTDVALFLAKKFNGELISCDSRQVYKGLDIGTGKMPGRKDGHPELVSGSIWIPDQVRNDIKKGKGFWEINGIKVWMYDVVSPKVQYTVYDYVKDAGKVIDGILQRDKLPIIVGGTGLYLKALLQGLPNLAVPVDLKLRGELEKLSLEKLQNKLQTLSPTKWENMTSSDKKNKRRLLRSIELHLMYPYIKQVKSEKCKVQSWDILKVGLTAPRQVLNQRIDLRLLARINQGMIEEASKLYKEGLSFKRMRQLGLEYGILADLLEGKINKEEFIERLKNKIHQYAKRQMTWFNHERDVLWFDINEPNMINVVENEVEKWYYSGCDTKN